MVKDSILPPMYANFYFNTLVFVGVLEYCTPNCNIVFVYWSMPIERKAVAMYGKIIYCICYMTSVRPHHTVCVT